MKKTQESDASESAGDLRGTLIKRLAVAGGLVAVLLGVLAFFDYLTSPDEPEALVFTKPVPVPPKKEVTQPVKPAEPLPEPAKPEASPEKAVEATAPLEPLPKPEVAARPAASVPRSDTKALPDSTPSQPPAARPAPSVSPVQAAATPVARPAEEPKAASSIAKPTETPVVTHHPPPTPMRLFSGFMLQAGVFTSVQRAEELHAKLTLNGIPSSLEARVQAGPFNNREEAAAAQEKMQALGIRAVLIAPRGAR